MRVKNEIKGELYIKLMNYILKKSDVVSLLKMHDEHEQETKKELNIVLSETGYSIDNMLEKYADKKYSGRLLNELYKKFRNNKEIFNRDYDKNYKKIVMNTIVGWSFYNKNTSQWIEKYKNDLVLKRDNPHILKPNIIYSTNYCYKLTDKIKGEILNKSSINDWIWPNSLEDICFFQKGKWVLYSVAHENICEIYCESEEEYKYLKSMGVEFWENEYEPITEEELYYNSYINRD